MGSRLRVEQCGSHVVPSSSAATGEREREDKLGFEGEKREGKESRKGERRQIWVEGGERRAGLFERASPLLL